MRRGFWDTLKKPFFILAPMADVTDAAFRRVIAKYGKPDVMYTEFVSADGLFCGGYDKLIHDLKFTEEERPIVAQFFSKDPLLMARAAKLAERLGFDGVDINMGCPDRAVVKQGAGAAMIKTPRLARDIIRATQDATSLPVSVKTRIGFHTIETETWVPEILKENPVALILHARTRKEMSKVPAHLDEITKAVSIRDSLGSDTLLVGNGDVENLVDAKEKAKETGADGIMLGRAIFGNPWLFSNLAHAEHGCQIENPALILPRKKDRGLELETDSISYAAQSRNSAERSECVASNGPREISAGSANVPSLEERLRVLVEHAVLFDELLGEIKSFAIMRKHFKSYVKGFPHMKPLIISLMETENSNEVKVCVEKFLEKEKIS